jgi:hypothetical protein
MTSDQLQARTKKDLVDLAKTWGIAGWHAMRKDQLIQAILQSSQPPSSPPRKKPEPEPKPRPQRAAARETSSVGASDELFSRSNGSPRPVEIRAPKHLPAGYGKDRIVLMVRDPYWLHVYWELTHQSIQRAEAALQQDWHGAKPVLRLYDISANDTTSTAETHLRDIEIHGGVNNWYIDVLHPPRSYRVDIGYLSQRGQFFVLARSNPVQTPRANVSETIDTHWADLDVQKADRLYAMSTGFDPNLQHGSIELKELIEQRLRRPLGSPGVSSFGSGGFMAAPTGRAKGRKFWFVLDAELIVYGATEPDARVTLQNEPIKLRPDGTFTVRFSLPDSRQIIPAVATSADGIEERTIVLSVERNTKHFDPVIHDVGEAE